MAALILQIIGILAILGFLFLLWPPLCLGAFGVLALLVGLSLEGMTNGSA